MPPIHVAAWVDSYRMGLRDALAAAAGDGFRFLHANANTPDLDPREFSRSARRHLAHFVQTLGARLEEIDAEFPGLGLADPRFADERIDRLRRTLELCADLKIGNAAVSIAGFSDEPQRGLATQVLPVVAELADRFDIAVAVRSSKDDPATVAEQVRRVGCPLLRVGLDAAVGKPGELSPETLRALAGAIHARDVRRVGERIEEVPFGQGEIDFPRLIDRLAEAEYEGAIAVRSDAAGGPVDALRRGREYIESLVRARRSG